MFCCVGFYFFGYNPLRILITLDVFSATGVFAFSLDIVLLYLSLSAAICAHLDLVELFIEDVPCALCFGVMLMTGLYWSHNCFIWPVLNKCILCVICFDVPCLIVSPRGYSIEC